MLIPKHAQKRLPADGAHLNELLDEALEQTFPASDPIAVDFGIESTERGSAETSESRAPLTRARKER